MLIQGLFYLFSTVLVLAALGVIISRNPVYSALALVMCFITSAAIWLLLEAEFLFEAERPPFVAGAGADVEAVVIILPYADSGANDMAGRVFEVGIPTLDAEVDGTGPGGQRKPLRLRVRPAERHGERNTGA